MAMRAPHALPAGPPFFSSPPASSASSAPAASGLGLPLPRGKRAVDALFLVHAIFAAVSGAAAFFLPHIFEFFMLHHKGETLRLFAATANDDQKVTHLTIRLFGALILAQAWIVFHARRITEPAVRRALVQAYTLAFSLMTAALVRAQVTEGGGFNAANWLNIALFAALSLFYAHFAIWSPIAVFEGLGKALS